MAARTATLSLGNDGQLYVDFRYDPLLVEAIKRIDIRARFHGETRTWSFPAETFIAERLVDLFGLDHPKLSPAIRQLLPVREPIRQPASLSVIDGYDWITEPYQHQRQGLADLLVNDRFLLAWDMGTGKTKVIADRIRHGWETADIESALILCPKSVMSVWHRQLQEHAGLHSWSLDGTRAQRLSALTASRGRLCIINYDGLASIADQLAPYSWDCLVADEVQFLKNATAKRSKLARKLRAKYRYALSGTPAPNSPLDWFGVLMFLDPNGQLAGTRYKTAFEARYAVWRKLENGGHMVVAYTNISDLRTRVSNVSSRVEKADCLDLPEKVFVTRTCRLAGEQARVYREMRRQAVTRLKAVQEESQLTATNILTEALRLVQITGGCVPDDAGRKHTFDPNAKICLFLEVLEEIGLDEPLVVWCSFRDELAAITELLSGLAYNVRTLTGDTSAEERQAAIDDFRTGKASAFVAMVQAGGVGIDGLQVRCSIEVFYSRTYNLSHWLQAQDRLHRLGQRQRVTVISLVAEGTIDEKIGAALDAKQGLMEAMMRTTDPENLL